MKSIKIASISLIGSSIKILLGPLILSVISVNLTTVELSFYFMFFTIINLQQLLEMGVGSVSKNYIAHVNEESDFKKVYSYFRFSIIWFFFIAIFILIVIFPVGCYIFSSKNVEIEWFAPWLLIVISYIIINIATPFFLYLDAIQKQIEFRTGMLISSLAYGVVLLILISIGCGLYSIPGAVFAGFISRLIYSYKLIYITLQPILKYKNNHLSFNICFNEMRTLLGTVSITWILGYFYWNGIGIIFFNYTPVEFSGKYLFTWNVANACYLIVASIINSQLTLHSFNISANKVALSLKYFYRYYWCGFVLLIIGYFVLLLIPIYWGELFNKFSEVSIMIQILLFYMLSYLYLIKADYCRCFKKDHFVYITIYAFITTPLMVLFEYLITDMITLKLVIFNLIIVNIYSFFSFRNFIKKYQ